MHPKKLTESKAETVLEQYFLKRDLIVVEKHYRVARNWGGGEIDYVVRERTGKKVFAVEMKSTSATSFPEGIPVLKPRQLWRLRKALFILKLYYPKATLCLALALVRIETGDVEFFENPC